MSAGCVCCTAVSRKATGEKALLVLLFTLTGDTIAPANIIEALCEAHASQLDSMIYRSLVPPHVKHALRKRLPTRLDMAPLKKRKRAKS